MMIFLSVKKKRHYIFMSRYLKTMEFKMTRKGFLPTFIEKAVLLARKNGMIAIIVPNMSMKSLKTINLNNERMPYQCISILSLQVAL